MTVRVGVLVLRCGYVACACGQKGKGGSEIIYQIADLFQYKVHE